MAKGQRGVGKVGVRSRATDERKAVCRGVLAEDWSVPRSEHQGRVKESTSTYLFPYCCCGRTQMCFFAAAPSTMRQRCRASRERGSESTAALLSVSGVAAKFRPDGRAGSWRHVCVCFDPVGVTDRQLCGSCGWNRAAACFFLFLLFVTVFFSPLPVVAVRGLFGVLSIYSCLCTVV